MVLVLYIALLVAALFLGLVSIFAGGSPARLAVAVLLVAFVPLLPAMLFYWRFVACKTGLHREKDRPWPEDPPAPSASTTRGLAALLDRVLDCEP